MLLSITTAHQPATDLGYLLHKHPDKFQSFELSFGHGHLFYSEANASRCTACLLVETNPIDLVRGRGIRPAGKTGDPNHGQGRGPQLLSNYVNDRPYVASSLMSVAISQILGTAMNGRCKERAELVNQPIPLEATVDVLPIRGGEDFARRLFEPLGYSVTAEQHPLDPQFPQWGESSYFSVTIAATKTLAELLSHLYVLIPVFDNEKHYFVGDDEVEKLLAKGAGWLESHPEKAAISRRYLKRQSSLVRQALARLVETPSDETSTETIESETVEAAADINVPSPTERDLSLNEQRHGAVVAALKASGANRVLDLGCGEGKLLQRLRKEKQFTQLLGVDISTRALEIAAKRLKLERLSAAQAERLQLLQASLTYRDRRLEGYDAAAIVEVIEHLDPSRLAALERVVFEFAKPETVIVTTPNREYNVIWESLPAGEFRHADHRFEWSRAEFQQWANRVAQLHGYQVRFVAIGESDPNVGSPTQMGVFLRG